MTLEIINCCFESQMFSHFLRFLWDFSCSTVWGVLCLIFLSHSASNVFRGRKVWTASRSVLQLSSFTPGASVLMLWMGVFLQTKIIWMAACVAFKRADLFIYLFIWNRLPHATHATGTMHHTSWILVFWNCFLATSLKVKRLQSGCSDCFTTVSPAITEWQWTGVDCHSVTFFSLGLSHKYLSWFCFLIFNICDFSPIRSYLVAQLFSISSIR